MNETMLHPGSYIKGKSKHWVWVVLILVLCLPVLQNLLLELRSVLGRVNGQYMAVAVAIWVVFGGGMAAALTRLGMACTVKIYQVLFLLLACVQLPVMISGVLCSWQLLYPPLSYCTQPGISRLLSIFDLVITILNALVVSTWVVCLFIIGCGKQANIIVRVSSILLALFIADIFLATLFLTKPRRQKNKTPQIDKEEAREQL